MGWLIGWGRALSRPVWRFIRRGIMGGPMRGRTGRRPLVRRTFGGLMGRRILGTPV